MEENKSYRVVPADIADGKMLFRIPLYQRLFAWSPIEVNQLMEDLDAHFLKHPNDSKKYYLGMLTVVRQDSRLDLIDGQQRMTVLALLSIGFMRVLEPINKEAAEKWRKVLYDASGNSRMLFSGRSNDFAYLQALAKSEATAYVNLKMSEGLEIIISYLTDNFKEEQLKRFSDNVYERMAYFITELPEHYVENPASLNEYFEAMNSSGKALEQHEILKVSLLGDQPDSKKIAFTKLWNRVSNFSKPLITRVEGKKDPSQNIGVQEQIIRYKQSINDCRNGYYDSLIEGLCFAPSDETAQTIASIGIEKKEESKSEAFDKEDAILSFAKFLLVVLAIHHGDVSIARQSTSKLLPTFKEKPPKDIEEFYHQLLLYRLLLDLYVVRIENTSGGGIHTLIARNEDKEEETLAKANERVRQYQAMLDVSTELHIWLLPLLKFLKDKERTQSEILLHLIDTDKENSHGTCPSLEDLNFGNRNRSRYWFWRLDYAIWEKQLLAKVDEDAFAEFGLGEKTIDKQAILEYEFRENRSIEHLHPRDEKKQPEKWDVSEINRFGNLAMISSSFNSEQLNWLVESKLENIKPQIDNKSLQSLKLYFMYLQAKKDGAWSQGEEGSMQRHEKLIYKLLEESVQKYDNGQQ